VQDDLGELARDHVGRPVAGGVVDDDDLDGDAGVAGAQRGEAGAEQVAAVPVGDAD
jgi:hypothetical protein